MSLSNPTQKEFDTVATYFNNQPDVLTAIVKHRTDIKGHLGHLFIITWDPDLAFVTLLLHPPGKEEVRLELPFDPPLKTAYMGKPRLERFRNEAFAHYKLPLKPPIKYYSPPGLFPYSLILVTLISALLFALYGWGMYADLFRAWIHKTFGNYMVEGSAIFAIVLHVIETGYMGWALKKHETPLVPSLKWLATTAFLGIASINEFWESIQYERLRMIYSQTDVGDIGPRVKGSEKEKTE